MFWEIVADLAGGLVLGLLLSVVVFGVMASVMVVLSCL
jgi:hypothetical protein